MKYKEFEDKLEKVVALTTSDGELINGTLFLGETEFDSTSGEDEVDILSYKGGYRSVPFSEIADVTLA